MSQAPTLEAPVADEPVIGGALPADPGVPAAQGASDGDGGSPAPAPPAPRTIDDLPDEELRSHTRVAGYIQSESERIRREAEEMADLKAQRTLRDSAQAYVEHGQFVKDLTTVAQKAGELGGELDIPNIEKAANVFQAAAMGRMYKAFEEFVQSHIPDDYQVPAGQAAALRAAERAYLQGRGTPDAPLKLMIEQAIAAGVAKGTAEAEAKAAEKYRKEAATAITTEKEAAAAAARSANNPTGVRGGAAIPTGQYNTAQGAAEAFLAGRISAAQYKHDRDTLPFA